MNANPQIPRRPRSGALTRVLSLAIRDLTVAYHRKLVVWDVDLTILEGKLVSIVGPNGAGKSTLLKACLDPIPRASGEVRVFGQPYAWNAGW